MYKIKSHAIKSNINTGIKDELIEMKKYKKIFADYRVRPFVRDGERGKYIDLFQNYPVGVRLRVKDIDGKLHIHKDDRRFFEIWKTLGVGGDTLKKKLIKDIFKSEDITLTLLVKDWYNTSISIPEYIRILLEDKFNTRNNSPKTDIKKKEQQKSKPKSLKNKKIASHKPKERKTIKKTKTRTSIPILNKEIYTLEEVAKLTNISLGELENMFKYEVYSYTLHEKDYKIKLQNKSIKREDLEKFFKYIKFRKYKNNLTNVSLGNISKRNLKQDILGLYINPFVSYSETKFKIRIYECDSKYYVEPENATPFRVWKILWFTPNNHKKIEFIKKSINSIKKRKLFSHDNIKTVLWIIRDFYVNENTDLGVELDKFMGKESLVELYKHSL